MINRRGAIGLLIPSMLTAACAWDEGIDPVAASFTPRIPAWPPDGFTRVTGYRFEPPEGESMFSVVNQMKLESGIIRFDPGLLPKITVASAELSGIQVKRLKTAVFNDLYYHPPGACYHPHHLFLFRDVRDEITGLIEVCFECHAIQVIPGNPAHRSEKHDFGDLAKLCVETGLGVAGRSNRSSLR